MDNHTRQVFQTQGLEYPQQLAVLIAVINEKAALARTGAFVDI
jgi:hypothetical protein